MAVYPSAFAKLFPAPSPIAALSPAKDTPAERIKNTLLVRSNSRHHSKIQERKTSKNYKVLHTIPGEPLAQPTVTTVSETRVVESASGAVVVTTRLSDGSSRTRIEYTREAMLKTAASPLTVLPPFGLKMIVLDMPEILAPFPTRHGMNH